jgi:hypothetical protein
MTPLKGDISEISRKGVNPFHLLKGCVSVAHPQRV